MAFSLSRLRARNPFLSTGTDLPPPLLLAAKVVAFLLLFYRWALNVPEPFVPFLPIFDWIGHPAAVRRVIQIASVLGALGVLFNVRPRGSSLLLGAAILGKILASRPTYYNNEVFCAALFLMIGLYEPGRSPWLLRAQVALVYFGAGLDKLLEPDWRSGQFFEVWTLNLKHTAYLHAKTLFPPMLLSRVFCWGAILVELALAPLLLVPRTRRFGILLGFFFHSALVLFAGASFGFFYFAILASYLAFMDERATRFHRAYAAYLALVGLTLTSSMDTTVATTVLVLGGVFLFPLALRRFAWSSPQS